ncbi:LPXTG cell wall anchor domain-containing protein [Glycomyces luteolus]|uniref:LPXTG cell wall anchor domain-containing protein n=1 Tax=Glycomyces luteolus TaxID=2670330 RepID=A0A9X3SPL1_9ACTN|nr:LPXTG cell wall anchor domain-containing protein [Glycomyces luteolus]MDA1358034.1 LPXTG cell wall anchor domain-containing protein [Glycomyces luteolus]
MNRTLKRVLGLSGSVVLGLAGAVTFASAAQAHHPTVSGFSTCAKDGGWTVTWLVEDWEGTQNATGTITAVVGDLDEDGDIFVGAALPAYGSEEVLEGTQSFTADQTDEVTLSVSAEWTNGAKGTTVSLPVGPPMDGCDGEEGPVVGFGGQADCVGIEARAWNKNPDDLQEFTFVSSTGEEVSGTPGIDEEFSHYFVLEDGAEELVVDIYAGEELVETIEWVDKVLCSYVEVEADCEGLIFTLTVPQDGEETLFVLWTSLSEEPTEVELAEGESATFTFKAEGDEELWVDYYIEGPKDSTSGGVSWIPCDEETPSPSDTPSAQPQLPTTGSSMTIMIGSAAALIVAAAAIFLIMRRRRAAQDW